MYINGGNEGMAGGKRNPHGVPSWLAIRGTTKVVESCNMWLPRRKPTPALQGALYNRLGASLFRVRVEICTNPRASTILVS